MSYVSFLVSIFVLNILVFPPPPPSHLWGQKTKQIKGTLQFRIGWGLGFDHLWSVIYGRARLLKIIFWEENAGFWYTI